MGNKIEGHVDSFGRDVEYSDEFDSDNVPEASEQVFLTISNCSIIRGNNDN